MRNMRRQSYMGYYKKSIRVQRTDHSYLQLSSIGTENSVRGSRIKNPGNPNNIFVGLGAMLFANLVVIATIFVMGYQSMLAEKNRNRPKARVYDIQHFIQGERLSKTPHRNKKIAICDVSLLLSYNFKLNDSKKIVLFRQIDIKQKLFDSVSGTYGPFCYGRLRTATDSYYDKK